MIGRKQPKFFIRRKVFVLTSATNSFASSLLYFFACVSNSLTKCQSKAKEMYFSFVFSIEYIWYNIPKYLPWSRAPSSGRNGPSQHPRNPQAGSGAAKNCFGLDKIRTSRQQQPKFFWNTHSYQLIWAKLHFLLKLLPGPKWQSWENP